VVEAQPELPAILPLQIILLSWEGSIISQVVANVLIMVTQVSSGLFALLVLTPVNEPMNYNHSVTNSKSLTICN